MALAVHAVSSVGLGQAPTVIDRINQVRRERDRQEAIDAMKRGISTRSALQRGLESSGLQDTAAKIAVEWLTHAGRINIIVNWQRLQEAGVNPDTPVSVAGQNLTVERALRLIVDQMAGNVPLVYDVTPWYVEILTKEMANARSIVQVYLIGDLLHTVPNFTDAPIFDLTQVGQSGKSGGGGGGLFQTQNADAPQISRAEQIENIIKLITDTIEPEIWKSNGGQYGSITVYRDSLIIRAPRYVHEQIGTPSSGPNALEALGLGASAPVKAPGAPGAPGNPANGAAQADVAPITSVNAPKEIRYKKNGFKDAGVAKPQK
jgi:hypothetical protein